MATAPARIEINPFPAGKRCAFTTSWDDGRVYDRRIVAAFNEWGIKGTFNLNSGSLTRTGKPAPADSTGHLDASEVASLFAGHEVAIHTVTHPHLHKLDVSQIATEVLDDRRALEDLVGYPVRGMAYPFGTYSSRVIDVLRGLGIVYSRTVENDASGTFPPREPLAWAPTMHKFNDAPPLPERFEKAWNGGRFNGVFYVWGHSYEFADRNDWGALERLFKPVAGKPDVWYCTNIELFDYEAARRSIAIAANRRSVYNPSAFSVALTVDKKLVEVPAGKTLFLG